MHVIWMIPVQLQGEVEKVTSMWLSHIRDLQYFSLQDTGEHAGERLGTHDK